MTSSDGFWSDKGRAVRARILAWWEPGPLQVAGAMLVLMLGVGGAVAFVSTRPSGAASGVPSVDARYAASFAAAPVDGPIDAPIRRPLEAWLQDLRDPTPRVRWTAVQELGRLGAADEHTSEIVAALVGALKDDHFMVRADAARALGAIGPDADVALAAVIAATEDPAAAVRAAAVAALPRIKPTQDAVTRR